MLRVREPKLWPQPFEGRVGVSARFEAERRRGVPSLVVEPGQERLERLHGPPRPGAPMHERSVRGDAVEPGREPRLAAKPGEAAVSGEERLLKDVRGIGLARQAAGQAVDPALVARDDGLEGSLVPRRGQRRERLVALLTAGAVTSRA